MSTILEPGQIEASAVMPPFLHLPPANLFALRAVRLEYLAEGNALGNVANTNISPERAKPFAVDFRQR